MWNTGSTEKTQAHLSLGLSRVGLVVSTGKTPLGEAASLAPRVFRRRLVLGSAAQRSWECRPCFAGYT